MKKNWLKSLPTRLMLKPEGLIGRALALAVLALWLGPCSPAQPAAAQGGWSEPFDVSDDQFGWFPDVAADATGAVHVIWGSGAQNPDADPNSPEASQDLLRYRVLRNGQWSPLNDVAFTCVGGFTVRNSIVANGDGRVNALVRTCFDVGTFAAPAEQALSASAWGRIQRLGTAYYNAIAADSRGVLHALYNESLIGSAEGATLLSEIFYRRSTDGGATWSVRMNLARLAGGDERMQIKVDGRDRIHAVWDHGSDWYAGVDAPEYAVYRRSDDGGATWRDLSLLGVTDGAVVQATLGLAADGSPIVTYRSANGSEIYYQTSPDGGDTWAAAQVIPGVRARDPLERNLDSYTMATDSAGRVHLLVAGFPEGSAAAIPMLLHLTWDGQSWSPPEVVAATPNRPIWPRLVVAGGNQLHAVWFSYTDASGWGERRVWYSQKAVDAPALTPPPPIVLPTAAVAAAAPASPEGTPVPNAAPALQPAAPQPPAAPASFADAPPPEGALGAGTYVTLMLAIVPVLTLLGLIGLVMLWRRSRDR